MTTHRLEADAEATGTMVVDEQGDEYFIFESQSYNQFECNCGETFESLQGASNHAEKARRGELSA